MKNLTIPYIALLAYLQYAIITYEHNVQYMAQPTYNTLHYDT